MQDYSIKTEHAMHKFVHYYALSYITTLGLRLT